MNQEQIFEKTLGIFKDVFNDEEDYDINTEFQDIDSWDSMENVVFLSKLEKEFGMKFKTEDMVSIKSFKDVVDCIKSKI